MVLRPFANRFLSGLSPPVSNTPRHAHPPCNVLSKFWIIASEILSLRLKPPQLFWWSCCLCTNQLYTQSVTLSSPLVFQFFKTRKSIPISECTWQLIWSSQCLSLAIPQYSFGYDRRAGLSIMILSTQVHYWVCSITIQNLRRLQLLGFESEWDTTPTISLVMLTLIEFW